MTEQTAPKPIVTRAAEATVAAASTAATVVVGLLPSLNTCLSLIVGGLVTWGGLAVKAHYETPKLVIEAADKPAPVAPVPMRVVVEPLDGIKADIAALSGKLDKVLERLPEVKAPVVGPSKRTKAAAR